MKIFTRRLEILASRKGLMHTLVKIANNLAEHDDQILVIFESLEKLEQEKHQMLDQHNRKRVGYKRKDED